MKIVDIQCFPIGFALDRPFANSAERHSRRGTTLVKVIADEGVFGWGEAYGPPLGVRSFIDTYLKPRLLGLDPFRIEFHWLKIQTHKGVPTGPMGGIDIALWDLKGRALGVPIYDLLGGKCIEEIQPYATGFFFAEDDPDSTEYLERETQEAVRKGFKALKMKIGFGKERDIRRIRKVREIAGESMTLMVDANQAYDLMTCLELAPHLEQARIRWLEEPLHWQSFEGYQKLRQKVSFAIAAGEAEYSYQGFIEAIRNRLVDVIQPDLAAIGGLTIARRVALLAEAFQVDFQPHAFGTILTLPASIQLMAALTNHQGWLLFPRPVMLEWDTTQNKMARDILGNQLALSDGAYRISAKPGLGVEVNEEALGAYRLDGAA